MTTHDYAGEVLGIIHPDNRASQNVIRKLGFACWKQAPAHGDLRNLYRPTSCLTCRPLTGGIAAVFSSDLGRAVETTAIAFPPGTLPVLLDWRLRECDYGDRNGASADTHMRDRAHDLDEPYPAGESWRPWIISLQRPRAPVRPPARTAG